MRETIYQENSNIYVTNLPDKLTQDEGQRYMSGWHKCCPIKAL